MSAILRQREPRYTNRRLTDLCHGEPCYLNITGCVGGTSPDCPSVPCHPNWLEDGKAVGGKAHDDLVAPGCPPCHWQLDTGTMLTTEQKKEIHERARKRWWRHLLASGKIKIQVMG